MRKFGFAEVSSSDCLGKRIFSSNYARALHVISLRRKKKDTKGTPIGLSQDKTLENKLGKHNQQP